MKKKIMAVLLAFALTVGPAAGPAGPVTVLAREAQERAPEDVEAVGIAAGDYTYEELEDGTLKITKYHGNDTELVIPSEIGGKRVTSIGNNAFSYCRSLTSVTIPKGVISIENGAFSYCISLTGVTIPESVTSIGSYVFNFCSSLTSIQVEEGNANYASESGMLYNKAKTELICCPKGIKGSVTIPGNVTSIGDSTFSFCDGLTSVTIPESVTSIGQRAFYACNGLTSVTIPDGVMSIEKEAFACCSGLTKVDVAEGNETYASEEGLIYNKAKTELICCPEGKQGSVIIPDGVTDIGEQAFYNCRGLTSVTISGSVTRIGGSAFRSCRSLTSVTILGSVTNIGSYAFCGCESLTSVTIPESVTRISDRAFWLCRSLTSVTIPESVTRISDGAFSDCDSLTGIQVEEGNMNYASESGVLYNKAKTELLCFPGGIKGSVTIPGNVTGIERSAFEGCNGLTSVTIPESVTKIGYDAFSGCDSLTGIQVEEGNADYASENGILYDKKKTTLKVYPGNMEGSFTLPKTVTRIESDAFYSGENTVKDIKIPEGITGYVYVVDCLKVESISIPSGVTFVGSSSTLKEIFYAGSKGSLEYSYPGMTTVHYNVPASDKLVVSLVSALSSDEPQKPGTNPGGGQQIPDNSKPDTPSAQQKAQAITANNVTKTYGAKPFSLGASALGGAALSYASSNVKVASVASNGTVTLKGCGVAVITVTAAETKDYKGAQKTVTLTVKPKKPSVTSVKSKKKKTATVSWKKDSKASGYLIECATDKKFKKNKVKAEVKKNKTVTMTVKKLKPGKKYYVRVCAYAKSGNVKVQGDWSKAKTVKVKK